ncbi:MAG: ATP-binding protein [Planctomycetota bacterium]|nr:ATP-binding protein [Planctomycetota bacterium]MDG1984784.1 ATP-binding protein [Planctomycetota bacterium]
MSSTSRSALTLSPEMGVEDAIASFTAVLNDLQVSHARLEQRAAHMEAELCSTNEELAAKVEELAEVKCHLESVLTSIPTGVVVYSADGQVQAANRAALEILGTQESEIIGAREWNGLAGHGADGEPNEVLCDDGETRVLARRYSTVVRDHQATGAVEVIEDQSALVRAQERLHRLDKTAALGTMAGGIAHEIRNPLHAIQGFAELLVREAAGESRATHLATRVREGVFEIEAIVSGMLGIAGDGDLHLEECDVSDLVEAARAAALQQCGSSDRWSIDIAIKADRLVADRIKVRQALRNLIANACDAQPDGGVVHVTATEERGAVEFRVSDAGPGLRPQDIHRLCDPFFTTRADGTGLGLALVQRVAQLHAGVFEPDSTPAALGGASFTLTIPSQRA